MSNTRGARKDSIKRILEEMPLTAEIYWLLRQRSKTAESRFQLKGLHQALQTIVPTAQEYRQSAAPGKKLFIFANVHYWIEHTALLGLALAAQGHNVTLGFYPYADGETPVSRLDLRRQNEYAEHVLELAAPLLETASFLRKKASYVYLPDELQSALAEVSHYDVQYIQQSENMDEEGDLYQLRMERNRDAAKTAFAYLSEARPDAVIIPNGSFLEPGAVYRVARFLGIPTTTYEFSELRDRIWIAHDDEVLHQDTDALWRGCQGKPLFPEQREQLNALMSSRRQGKSWEMAGGTWQGAESKGGEVARNVLGLDSRPIVLLPTNVLGDSFSIGRQIFSRNMEEWLTRTVQYFTGRSDVQLIVRIHPGEVLSHGASILNILRQMLPSPPENIHLIGPQDPISTYDLIEIADAGLVYTTTVGLEMAMSGLPVVVSGKAHYRGRGFTSDPDSWVSYYKTLNQILADPAGHRLQPVQVERACRYAYYFFLAFPRPFPWHLSHIWEDYAAHPLESVLSQEGEALYGDTWRYLTGEPIDWERIVDEGYAVQA